MLPFDLVILNIVDREYMYDMLNNIYSLWIVFLYVAIIYNESLIIVTQINPF
jgi:hypothetical protein